jgi:hypothetical protein
MFFYPLCLSVSKNSLKRLMHKFVSKCAGCLLGKNAETTYVISLNVWRGCLCVTCPVVGH